MIELDIFLEGIDRPVGRLEDRDGRLRYRYLDADPASRLSLSLPVREQSHGDGNVRAFFANLLFENEQRHQVTERHGLDDDDVAGLLHHLGRDCPGAVSCVPVGEGPAKQPGRLDIDYTRLDQDDLDRMMQSLHKHRRVPSGMQDPSPLAGVQGKVAVTRMPDGCLALPKPRLNVPTTHILKVPRPWEPLLANQEHIMMQLADGLLDHPVAETEILEEGGVRGLLVARFDRQVDGLNVRRLHQEDFCQALGLAPDLKYERRGGGLFSAAAVGVLADQAAVPGLFRQAFLELTLVNLLLGNTDGHAKNHALLHDLGGPRLAPAYDIVPTLIDEHVTHQLPFNIGRAKMTDEITGPDLERFARDIGFPRITPALRRRIASIVAAAAKRIDGLQGPVYKRIGDAMAEQIGHLAEAISLDIYIPERDLVVVNRPDDP